MQKLSMDCYGRLKPNNVPNDLNKKTIGSDNPVIGNLR